MAQVPTSSEKPAPTEQELDRFVQNNIGWCQSSLVGELLDKEIFNYYEDIENLTTFVCPECGHGEPSVDEFETPAGAEMLYMCPECKKTFDDEPEGETQEILEWWLVDNWMADKLRSFGEPILDNDFGTWWGRTRSGQAISMDNVIKQIYLSL